MNYQLNAGQSSPRFPGAVRSRWIPFALIAFLVFFAVQPSYGAVATRVAGALTAPAGIVFLGADPWVSDHILGFCRMDPGVGGTFVLNPGTCSTAALAVGQAAVDGNNVYLTDNDVGVVRLTFNPATRSVGTPVVIAAGLLDLLSLPTSAAFGPDGNLYVGYIRSGNVERIANPGGLAGTQTVTTIGAESSGAAGGIMAMTFVGNDLYLASSVTPEVIANAPACLANGCTGATVAGNVAAPTAITFDGTNLFISTISAVFRFDPATPATPAVLFANGGTIPPATTVLPFQNLSALGVNGTTLLTADDPTAGGAFGQGRLWQLLTTALPGPSFPNMVLGTLGGPPLNFTASTGLLWLPGALGGHFWVSDHLQGFCRLDADPVTGLLAINAATCNLSAVSPGQAGFDPFRNFVYLPDNARNNNGILRLTFNPATETITNGVPIINDAATIADQPNAITFGPDNKAYVGFIRTGQIRRIANPQGPAPTMELVGNEPGGLLVTQLAFVKNDLFIAGSLNLGKITNAAACSGACTATVEVGQQISTPAALAYDGARFLYVGTADTVWRFNPTTGIAEVYSNLGNTTVLPTPNQPYQNFGALALNPAGTLFGIDDPTIGALPLTGRLWAIRPYLLPIKDAKRGDIGAQVSYTLNFKNTSGVADSFTLNHLGHAWITTGTFTNTGTTNSGPMAIDAETTATILVTVPTGIFPLSDTVEVSATSDLTLTSKTFSLLTTTKNIFPIHMPVILGGAIKP